MSHRILAIETSGTRGGIATWDGSTLREALLDPHARTTQALAPAIRDLLVETHWKPSEVDVVAVTVGPGSFTGLRIGVTTAKSFAYAASAKVVGIDTLDAVAEQLPTTIAAGHTIETIVDAFRGQLFAASFVRRQDGSLERLGENRVVDLDAWMTELREHALVSGPGLTKYRLKLPASVRVAPEEHWLPKAATIAQLAAHRAAASDFDDVFSLAPQYHRLSAAEEKRLGQ